MAERVLFGRQTIYSNIDVITRDNVRDILNKALSTHNKNKLDINYLYEYYKGNQPILSRTKTTRPEINNKIIENRANEIIAFKVGYLMGEPVQYVARGDNENVVQSINILNEYMFAEDKAAKDKELADWFSICGTSYRMVLPDIEEIDEAPFEIYSLDPRQTLLVYSSRIGNKPLMGVIDYKNENGETVYCVYTKDRYYEITNDKITTEKPHALGEIPIIEYSANTSKIGAFEVVLPILDAINRVSSNRLDGVEQFIQSLLKVKGMDITTENFRELFPMGGILLPPDGEVDFLTQELNQTQTQTLVDYLYATVLTICGMPNRNGGSSTSDTGAAVIMRDGWSAAEARAKDAELMFKKSEKQFLKLVLNIMRGMNKSKLNLSNIDIRFTRRNYENIMQKAQVLDLLLKNPDIHPQLAFSHSGMFVDSEMAYTMSREWSEQNKPVEREVTQNVNTGADTVTQ